MMVALTLMKASAAAAVAILGPSSLINMSQTYSIMQTHKSNDGTASSFSSANDDDAGADAVCLTLSQIKAMKRQELIRLYLSSKCEAPKQLSDIAGEWDGLLLDNNGLIMVCM